MVDKNTIEMLKELGTKPLPRYTSYPTAPEWMDSVNDGVLFSRLKSVKHQGKGLALYIHIPFCQQQCWYCGCNTIIKKRSLKIYLPLFLGLITIKTFFFYILSFID